MIPFVTNVYKNSEYKPYLQLTLIPTSTASIMSSVYYILDLLESLCKDGESNEVVGRMGT